ncbi:hypothetical protein R5W24_006534, partial [Gemmata sp. JC717]|uniref:hypothetical protein n=1 Tax=Gemmata algarum TaxID=2975278 RepID=UPI0021BAECAA
KVTVTAATFGVDNYDLDDTTVLIPGHAYAVVGYDANKQILKITNPWNNSAYTYGTTFDTMTVDEFCKKFGAICIESRAGVNAQP